MLQSEKCVRKIVCLLARLENENNKKDIKVEKDHWQLILQGPN